MVSTHLKNISQIGSSPQVGMKIKNVWNHHLDIKGNQWLRSRWEIEKPWFFYFMFPHLSEQRNTATGTTQKPVVSTNITSVVKTYLSHGKKQNISYFPWKYWLFNHGILVVNFFNEINIHITRLCNIPPKKPSPGGPFFGSIVKRQYQKKVMICAKCDHPIGQLMLLLCHKGEKKNSAGDGASFDSRHQTSSNTVYQYWLITSSYSYQNVDMYAWLKHKFRGLVLLEVFLNKWTVQTYAMKSNRNHIESPNFADPPQSCGRGSLLWSCSFVQQKIAQDSGICKLNHIYLESLLPKYEVQSVYSQLYSGLNQNELN